MKWKAYGELEMIKSVKNKDGEVKCPVCKGFLDGKLSYVQVAGETKATWVHSKCLGGKSVKDKS